MTEAVRRAHVTQINSLKEEELQHNSFRHFVRSDLVWFALHILLSGINKHEV